MYHGFWTFLHIFLLATTRKVSFAQTENSQETQLTRDNYESALSFIETKSSCNYEDPGRRFSNEINNIGKCVNPFFEKESSLENIMEAEKIANRNDERNLISLEIENNNEVDYKDSHYNIYPNYDEVCLLEDED